MERRPPAISPGKYVFWSFLAVLSIILLGVMISYVGLMGTAVIFGLTLVIWGKVKYGWLIKAWETGKLSSVVRHRPANNISYYQPSRQPYAQGYQQQPSRQHAATSAAPKEDHPSEYEQPQAQYPEQIPPMG